MNIYFLTHSFQKPHSNSSYGWISRLFTIPIKLKNYWSKYIPLHIEKANIYPYP